MRSKRTTPEEQQRLISECRQSGLTDYEWCEQNGIKAATFYVWIHRLKQKGVIDTPAVIPTVVRRKKGKQDVVKVEIEEEKSLVSAALLCNVVYLLGGQFDILATSNQTS